jgi:hypothetical protein
VIRAELSRAKALLDQAGIRFMVLKGVASEARWYGRTGERPCWDLDLLVDPGQFDRVDEALSLLQPDHVLRGHAGSLIRAGHLQSFTVLFGRIVIDLHTDLFKFGVPSRGNEIVWQTATALDLEDVGRVTVPHASVALVHFLTHLNRDRFNRLLGFLDVDRVLADPSLDWDLSKQVIAGDSLETICRSALATVEETLGRPRSLPPPSPGWRRAAWRALWSSRIRLLGTEGQVRFTRRALLLPFLLHGRTIEAIGAWRRRLFPPALVVEYLHGDQPGSGWTQALRGRIGYMRRRWAARRRLRGER